MTEHLIAHLQGVVSQIMSSQNLKDVDQEEDLKGHNYVLCIFFFQHCVNAVCIAASYLVIGWAYYQ